MQKFTPAVFDYNVEQLNKIVATTKGVNADPTKITKEELELVATTRREISKVRSGIKAEGLAHRDEANKFAKDVIAYEKTLLEIVEPELDRLKDIESDSKAYQIRQVRLETLPALHERLTAVGDGITDDDEELLAMDPTEFEAYFNQRCANKNVADAAALAEAQNKVDREKELLEATEKARIEEREKAEKDKKDEVARVKLEQELEAERVAKEKKDREADDKYQAFLKKHKYNDDDFFLQTNNATITLYKKVAVYTK